MKIYTRTGDEGTTGLFGGGRVSKHSPRIEAYGTVDELNAAIGVARSHGLPMLVDSSLEHIQNDLFVVGAELANPSAKGTRVDQITAEHVLRLEELIDRCEARLGALKQFILPGGTPGAAALHLARTVCRRAERRAVELAGTPEESVSAQIVVYLNRLSDLLFVLARTTNAEAGVPDVKWDSR